MRVSRQNRNEDSRESPEVQRRLITRFAGPQGQGWDLIEILDETELRSGNVSGGGDISRRLGFSAAIKRIEAGKADVIVVADHGRLFRDIDVQRAAIDRVEGAGGQLWAVSSGRITHATADAELMANLKG
ncbi:MAG: recombinase family protein, partial [Solirubrobacteraceae bacterium]